MVFFLFTLMEFAPTPPPAQIWEAVSNIAARSGTFESQPARCGNSCVQAGCGGSTRPKSWHMTFSKATIPPGLDKLTHFRDDRLWPPHEGKEQALVH